MKLRGHLCIHLPHHLTLCSLRLQYTSTTPLSINTWRHHLAWKLNVMTSSLLGSFFSFKITFCLFIFSGQTSEGSTVITVTNDKPTSGEANAAKSNLLPVQQRIIKQLLQTSTALGRALSDLFVLLVKLCVGSAQRMQRRTPHLATPTPPAYLVALELNKLLKDALSWQGFPSDIPALKPR